MELNLARKIHGKRRSKKNLEGLYEVLAPGSHILNVSPTTSTIKEPRKTIVTVRNSDVAKFGTQLERQKPLKAHADRRGPRSGEKLVEELIQSHVKEFTRKQKGDKKMKHRKRDPGSGVSSSKSNISREMRARVPKVPKFLALRNQKLAHFRIAGSKQLFPQIRQTAIGEAHHTTALLAHLLTPQSQRDPNDLDERGRRKLPASNRVYCGNSVNYCGTTTRSEQYLPINWRCFTTRHARSFPSWHLFPDGSPFNDCFWSWRTQIERMGQLEINFSKKLCSLRHL